MLFAGCCCFFVFVFPTVVRLALFSCKNGWMIILVACVCMRTCMCVWGGGGGDLTHNCLCVVVVLQSLTLAMTLHEKGRAALKTKNYSKALLLLLEADKEFK